MGICRPGPQGSGRFAFGGRVAAPHLCHKDGALQETEQDGSLPSPDSGEYI